MFLVRKGPKIGIPPTLNRGPNPHLKGGFGVPNLDPSRDSFHYRCWASKQMLMQMSWGMKCAKMTQASADLVHSKAACGCVGRSTQSHTTSVAINPISPRPSHDLEKGVFCPKKIPTFYVFPCRKKGFFDRKLPFPG